MKVKLTIFAALFLISFIGFSQDKEFKPSGKAFGHIFTHYGTNFTNGAFDVSRAYVGYKYKFSKELSAKVTYDISNPGDGGKLEYTTYLKNAYVAYDKDALSVKFGQFGTNTFGIQQKSWGHRYLYKTFMDINKFAPSTDFGVMAAYKIHDMVSIDAAFLNGSGFKTKDTDNIYKTTAGVTLKPTGNITFRAYFDIMDIQQTIAFFGGYATDAFSVGAEYNMQFNSGLTDGNDQSGLSTYAVYNLNKTYQVFGRFDMLSSGNNWSTALDGQTFIAGFQYAPVKGVKISPNFQGFQPAVVSADFQVNAMLNLELKF